MPKKLQLSSGGVATYTYDAAGVKRKVEHQGAGENKTTDYCGNVIYENGALNKILTEEGYITLSGTTPTYHYYLKDHLGNNWVVLNQNGTTVEQVSHYYPFGGLFDQTSETLQAYKYNGKELDRTYGIDLYDYSARFMDGAVGRFTTMDPMAEKYYSMSPYLYCGGNPVKFVDPTGMEYGDPSWGQTFWSGFTKPFRDFGNFVSHPIETIKGMISAVGHLTPLGLATEIGGQILKNPISPVSGVLNQMDVAKAVAYDQVNGTLTSAEVVGNQWGNITFDGATAAAGAGVGKVGGTLGKVFGGTGNSTSKTVYRVFGGDARAQGYSWTPVNPKNVMNFRDAAGLPSGGMSKSTNTADFMIKGEVNSNNIIKKRFAIPLDENKGGLPEYIIEPKNVNITDFSVLNP